jgi:hypothetical protein
VIPRIGLAAALAALVFSGFAAAKPPTAPLDLHDARYCEVLELRGELPNARVNVWNTIGLNDCPAAKLDAIDPAALAAETGAKLVLINGPRHFLMDSATARVGRRVESIGGMRMRKVATIPIASAADLVQRTYSERTIERINTWTWERGRRVYELLAPGGVTYVMQSYSQIRDPALAIGDLRSIGERLTLPEGWSFRSRRLRHDLTLGAQGEATIIQDDLLNTYQRAPGRDGA